MASLSNPDEGPEDFPAHVREVQERLAKSVARAGLTGDAYAKVIEALSETLSVLPAFVEEVSQAKEPWAADERREVVRAAAQDMRGEVLELAREEWHTRMLITAAAGVAIAVVAFIAGDVNGNWGRTAAVHTAEQRAIQIQGELSEAVRGLTAPQAYEWSRLIRWNSDVSLFRRECTRDDIKGHGRQYCTYTLWDEPPPPPTVDQPGK